MPSNDDRTGGMGKLADEVAREVDEKLAGEESALVQRTTADLEKLRPQISDSVSFDKLVAAVEESTQRNESAAQLKQRIENLGKAVVRVAKEAAAKIPSV